MDGVHHVTIESLDGRLSLPRSLVCTKRCAINHRPRSESGPSVCSAGFFVVLRRFRRYRSFKSRSAPSHVDQRARRLPTAFRRCSAYPIQSRRPGVDSINRIIKARRSVSEKGFPSGIVIGVWLLARCTTNG